METRIREHAKLSDVQNGFRSDRRCCDHAAILHDLIKNAKNKKLELYIAIFDFQKAFDNVEPQKLLHKMRKMGIPSYLINIVG
jgi:HD superfamily phosphohydrolase YqeK